MREILLANGRGVAIVDDADYELVLASADPRWRIHSEGYTTTGQGTRMIYMHRLILPGVHEVDHVNGNRLDNRRANLRPATRSQNNGNACPKPGGTSRFKGVSWSSRDRVWRAFIGCRSVQRGLCSFSSEEAAARAYDAAALDLWGEYALTNRRAGLLPGA